MFLSKLLRHICLLTLLSVFSAGTFSAMASGLSDQYVGSAECKDCHEKQYTAWQGSHHQQAMMLATNSTVLGNFNNQTATHKQRKATFYQKLDNQKREYFVSTQNKEGVLQEYKISYTFGVYPLQQYVINFENGRKQVLDIAWDARSRADGGQAWFYLGSDYNAMKGESGELMAMDHGEYFSSASGTDNPAFFWTEDFYNWNSRCASCHVTGFKKQFDFETGTYGQRSLNLKHSRSDLDQLSDVIGELGVGCEACHGPAKNHLKWVKEVSQGKHSTASDKKHSGFQFEIQDQGAWSPVANAINTSLAGKQNAHTAKDTFSLSGASASKQVEVCAGCHSRRLQLQDRDPNLAFTDNYMPMFVDEPIYYSDGQSKDENFVWGSFTQSKMHQAGVVCSNCHNPHSVKLKGIGIGIGKGVEKDKGQQASSNPVCLQCHQAQTYESKQHHKHDLSKAGSQCISCHMPATTFMNVDKRFDHSFKVPSGHISGVADSPNTCLTCHNGKDTAWVKKTLDAWYPQKKIRPQHQFSEAFAMHAKGDVSAPDTLHYIANSAQYSDMVRASALAKMSGGHSQLSFSHLPTRLKDPSDLIRLGAVRSMSALPLEHKLKLLTPLFTEKNQSVRIEIARQLSSLPINSVPKNQQKFVLGLFDDLIQSAKYNGDTSANLVVLADFYFAQGELKQAERYYLKALNIQQEDEAALLNLADLYRALGINHKGEDAKGLVYLKRAVTAHPASSNARYALGLYYVRIKDMALAEIQLKKAWAYQQANLNYAYAYGLVLKEQSKRSELITLVDDWQRHYGSHPYIDSLLK